jgi:hypothetical protein
MVSISRTTMALGKRNGLEERVLKHAWRLSKMVWPWPEARLLIAVGILAGLDYLSTLAFLHFSAGKNVYEAGVFASRALRAGGCFGLLIMDVAIVGALMLTAICLRKECLKKGLTGFARLAFTLLLLPYAATAAVAVVNNIIIALI